MLRPAMLDSQLSGLGSQLRRYFYSGWAFLIPYLAAYLLYAWLKWPVNPANGVVEVESWVPSLLHLYWALHVIHLILGVTALCHWLKTSPSGSESYAHSPSPLSRLWPLLPWGCLALLFCIPGVYLEFPADTWAHLGRITLWEHTAQVRDHATWTKSAYFLYASLLPPSSFGYGPRLAALTLIHVGTSILLCWQHYRLGRVLQLGTSTAFIFVLLQAFMLGSSSFSFYRYYSLSSTILGQLAATAAIVLSVRQLIDAPGQASGPRPFSWPTFGLALTAVGLLAAFNHPQAVAITGVGAAAVVAAWLFMRHAHFTRIALLVAVAGSILVIAYYPRHAALDELYLPAGWLTRIYSFNLFSPDGPAVARSLDILGAAGVLNLLLAVGLMRRHLLAGLLCLAPLLALLIPLTSLPFASVLARGLETPIRMFHRLYFAAPAGLALVLGTQWVHLRVRPPPLPVFDRGTVLLLLALLALVTVPGSYPWLNRSYHLLMRPPADASYEALVRQLPDAGSPDRLLIATPGGEYVAGAWNNTPGLHPLRLLGTQTMPEVLTVRSTLVADPSRHLLAIPPAPLFLYTPVSTMSRISGHWPAVAVALDQTKPEPAPEDR